MPFPYIHTHTNTHAYTYTTAAAAKSLQSYPTMQPHRRQPTRLPRPWDSPDKNTGEGCHFLLQCWKVKTESEVPQSSPTLSDPMDPTAAAAKSLQSCPTLCDPMDGSPPGSPVPGILQTRILEWVAISFSNA